MKTFKILRIKDLSGVSGTGLVAEGVQFDDGQVCVSWHGKYHIVEVCKDIETWEAVHGHGGSTTVVWDKVSVQDLPQDPQEGASVVLEQDTGDVQEMLQPPIWNKLEARKF